MLSSELIDGFAAKLAAAKEIHRAEGPNLERSRPPELMAALTSLCQEQIDVVFELNAESGVDENEYKRFQRCLREYDELVAEVQERGDLLPDDDSDVVTFREHTNDRIQRITESLEIRRESDHCVHRHVHWAMESSKPLLTQEHGD